VEIPVICIDGPGGSGKGTVAHRVAEALGWHCLDSGALYRIAAVAGRSRGISLDDEPQLIALMSSLQIRFEPDHIWVDDEDFGAAIRGEEAGAGASRVGALAGLRAGLLQCQRDFAVMPGLVADGRDMGTVVFPQSPLKIFLTATAEERARRRYNQLKNKEEGVTFDSLLDDIRARDGRDRSRSVAPMQPAADSVIIDSTEMTIDEVVKLVMDLASQRGLCG
jgi:cytidylate kinase